MGFPYTMSRVPVTGDVVQAVDINTSNQEHINSNIPEDIDDYSVNATEMKAVADPYSGGSESLATNLAGEIERLRYVKKQITGEAQWYIDPSYSIVELAAARRNAFINADFNHWQRGTSFAAIAANAFHADKWRYEEFGGVIHTVSRSTDVPTLAESGHLSNYSLLVDCTTEDAAPATSDYAFVSQRIEGFNFAPLAQKSMVLTFWHKHTKAGTYCVSLGNSIADKVYIAEYTQSVSDTWEQAKILVTASPSAGTWDYTTGIGIHVKFSIFTGSDFHGTVDTWNSSDLWATSNQVNNGESASNNFRLAQVQLKQGNVITTVPTFEGVDYATELNQCRRYARIVKSVMGVATTTTVAQLTIPHEGMRAAPSVSATDVLSITDYHTATYEQSSASISIVENDANGGRYTMPNFTGLTQGDAVGVKTDGDGHILLEDTEM